MNLGFKCRHCRAINTIRMNARDRSQIRERYPNGLSVTCGTCHKQNDIVPNDIKARESKYIGFIRILGLLISMVIGGIFLAMYWTNDLTRDLYVLAACAAIISLPPILTNLYIMSERKAVKVFNNYYV